MQYARQFVQHILEGGAPPSVPPTPSVQSSASISKSVSRAESPAEMDVLTEEDRGDGPSPLSSSQALFSVYSTEARKDEDNGRGPLGESGTKSLSASPDHPFLGRWFSVVRDFFSAREGTHQEEVCLKFRSFSSSPVSFSETTTLPSRWKHT